MRGTPTTQEVKNQITEKIKNGTLTVSGSAKEYGIADNTNYGWFGNKATGEPGTLELARLKRENLGLARLVGMLTLEIEKSKKRTSASRAMLAQSGVDPPTTKKELALEMGIARSSLYYVPKIPAKDLILKARIEEAWVKHPAYGWCSLAIHLSVNHKRIKRVMRLFGMKVPRAAKSPTQPEDTGQLPSPYPNFIKDLCPLAPGVVWAGDVTYIPFHGKFLYLVTVMDIYTREILGKNILMVHTIALIRDTFVDAKNRTGHIPLNHHSDQGSEYTAITYLKEVERLGILVSMSKKASSSENGYQESFYRFKLELGGIGECRTIGEAVAKIYTQIAYYNTKRNHTVIKISPQNFKKRHHQITENRALEGV